MSSDIGNWFTYLTKELKIKNKTKMVLCKELKLIAIHVLRDFIQNLKREDLIEKLEEIQLGFDIIVYKIKNDKKLSEVEKLSFLAISQSLVLLIDSINNKIKEDNDFNCIEYFTQYRNNLRKAKTSKDILKVIGSDETKINSKSNSKQINNNEDLKTYIELLNSLTEVNKDNSKNKLTETNNSSDTEYEDDSDEEYIEEDDSEEYVEEDDSEEYVEEDESEEYVEDDIEDEIVTRTKSKKRRGLFLFMNNSAQNKKKKFNNKEDKEFIETIGLMIENNGSKGLRDEDEREQFENKLLKYFSNNKNKNELLEKFKNVLADESNIEPLLFKIINLNISTSIKNDIVNEYLNMEGSYSDKAKIKGWLENVIKLPFGKSLGKNFNELRDPNEIKTFIQDTNRLMNEVVYGHDEAKKNIIQIMVQYITNPESIGSCIGIWGPPGNGKTTLIKEGVSKAMGREFIFISLGGATDASYLEGHSFTYEGSIYGRIAQSLMKSKCMNPIIYFDELDKVSKCYKGMEIVNCLVHLVDPSQNNEFIDKYFYNLKLDLSKVTFMFSYNDPNLIDPILKDRITQIQTKYLLLDQKIHIAQNYLIPNILKEIGLDKNSIEIKDKIIEQLIFKYTNEGGVRKIKQILYSIIRQINILNLTNDKLCDNEVVYPFKLKKEYLPELLQEFRKNDFQKIQKEDKVGIINGLWAGSLGIGGILPIECKWIPSKEKNYIEATGSLEKVIKESVKVASTLTWNLLDDKTQKELNTRFEKEPYGIHIHCPDGATPKDGPSAGTALTILLLSLYTNRKIKKDLAITGEINLQGQVLEIGGLEEKLTGGKKAGIKTALIPKSNNKDIEKIKLRNPKLISEDFKVISVENINQVIDLVFV